MIRKQLKEEVVPPPTAAVLTKSTLDPQDTVGGSQPAPARKGKKGVHFKDSPVIIQEKPAPATEEVESLTPPDSPIKAPKQPDQDNSLMDITMQYASDGSDDNKKQQAGDSLEEALLLSLVGEAQQPLEEPVTGSNPADTSILPSLAKLEELFVAELQKDPRLSRFRKLVQEFPTPPELSTESTPRQKYTAAEKGKSVADPTTETSEQPTPEVHLQTEKPAQKRRLPRWAYPESPETPGGTRLKEVLSDSELASESEEEEMDADEIGQWLLKEDQDQAERDIDEITEILTDDPLQLIPNIYIDMFLHHSKQGRALKAAQVLLKKTLKDQKRQKYQIRKLKAAEEKAKREALAQQKAGTEEESKKLKAEVAELTLANQGKDKENKALLTKQKQLQQKNYLLVKAQNNLLTQLSEAEKKRADEEKEKKKLEQEHKAQLKELEAEKLKAKALEAEKAALVAKLAQIETEGDASVAEAIAACGGNKDKALSRQTKRYISYKTGYQKAVTELNTLKAELEKKKAEDTKGKGKAPAE